VAMVFQNYALYPHLSVAENIAFGLRLRKTPKNVMDERVQWAAKLLDLQPYLNRRPKELSGGQRQRVAMGRAIVRNPQVFLMDEPLSNLDAKLRVQMRSEIAKIQRDLGTTTIYVTHDQVEAMTMGDRVAVMRKGLLQQVEPPQVLYDHPVNLFVAGFIGSPAMNMVEGTLVRSNGSMFAEFGEFRLRVADETVRARPALSKYEGKKLVIGLRPESMEDASLVPEAPEDRRIGALVELREALGSQVAIHFTIDAPTVLTEDTKELAHDLGAEALEDLTAQAEQSKSKFVAQLDPRTRVLEGDRIELVVETDRFHFFDPETSLGIYTE
jgi:multiple sugar transport system ATP-binding protein